MGTSVMIFVAMILIMKMIKSPVYAIPYDHIDGTLFCRQLSISGGHFQADGID
jgi:hypothetical protein